CLSYFSLVLITPVKWPHTSFAALTLRTIIGTSSFGKWQSAQVARTPVRFLSWMVSLNSAAASLVWQLEQNSSVLVMCTVTAAATVMPPPTMPQTTSTAMASVSAERFG